MIKGKTIRKFIGFLAFLILLVPFLGIPQSGKDALIVGLSLFILFLLLYKPVLIEIARLYAELSSSGERKKTNEQYRENRIEKSEKDFQEKPQERMKEAFSKIAQHKTFRKMRGNKAKSQENDQKHVAVSGGFKEVREQEKMKHAPIQSQKKLHVRQVVGTSEKRNNKNRDESWEGPAESGDVL